MNAYFSSLKRINVVKSNFVADGQFSFNLFLTNHMFIVNFLVFFFIFELKSLLIREKILMKLFSSTTFSCPSVTSVCHDDVLEKTEL